MMTARRSSQYHNMPWRESLGNDKSDLSQLADRGDRIFHRRDLSLCLVANALSLPIKGLLDLVGGDRELLAAVVF